MLKKKQNYIFLLYGAIYLLFFYAFMYADILITASHGINMWDILFDGKIFEFFQLCKSDINNAAYQAYYNAYYDFPIYILFGVWNFPLWLIRKIWYIDIWHSAFAMIWIKSMLLLFLIGIVKCLVEIGHTLKLKRERIELVIVLFVTSTYLFSCVFVMGQYDIIHMFFTLMAFNYILKNNMKRFVCFVALSILFKPFALFIYIPLILYHEKNVFKVLGYTVCVLCPLVVVKTLFPPNTDWNVYSMSSKLLENSIRISEIEVPIFAVFMLILYIWCYIRERQEEQEKYMHDCIMIAYMALLIFFLTCLANPYWMIMIVPFQYLVIAVNRKYTYINVLVESITAIAMVLFQTLLFSHCYSATVVRASYLGKLGGGRFDGTETIYNIIGNFCGAFLVHINSLMGLLFAAYIAGNLFFIWLNFIDIKATVCEKENVDSYLFYLRLLVGLLVCGIPILAYVF